MAATKVTPEVTLKFHLELTEEEARVLSKLATYSYLDVCKALEHLSLDFREGSKGHKAMTSLCLTLRNTLPEQIRRADAVHEAVRDLRQ